MVRSNRGVTTTLVVLAGTVKLKVLAPVREAVALVT